MPDTQPVLRRLHAGRWYQRVPCDPPPADLARRLTEACVASKAAKRIDTYDRYRSQHEDHRRAVVRGVLGAAGLVLSLAPGVPALATSCSASRDVECGLRVMAMAGGALALTVTGWAFWELYRQPIRLSDHIAKLNAEMARSMQAKNGDVAVERLFDLYRGMSRHEQLELKSYLHDRAAEPQPGTQAGPSTPAPALSLAGGPPSTLAGDDPEDDVASTDWRDLEAGSLPPEALRPPGSPRPWHGVQLRRASSGAS